jgi:putative DNA primase/helicase
VTSVTDKYGPRPRAERKAEEATLDEIRARLDGQAVDICEHLYGKPTIQRRREYRWGRRGSVQLVHRKGRWRWNNYETGEGGSMFDAIMSSHGLDFAGAVEWARTWFGGEPTKPQTRQGAVSTETVTDVDIEQELNGKQAVAIWDAGRPVVGTLADQYLRQQRGIGAAIPYEVARYVEGADIRRCRPKWHWLRWPGALVVAASDNQGCVTGVQLIVLKPDGTAARHWASTES